ncbi:DUF4244 domain-containing protein [Peterkaempfera bronchialis]|uniref:DUF4244 domain-containing protein n=1 Tax=Peterkaempfera bronchialis TaxID=2126346 RepID=A0A345SYL7_9ACTN|nr:DUF4244 domain-containing protein [Peterkaempfera bronchialis]AXI78822.1 DUF4244 domain-containing protein [Peterkaempfera bronchialis]
MAITLRLFPLAQPPVFGLCGPRLRWLPDRLRLPVRLRPLALLLRRRLTAGRGRDAGMTTAEYAVGTVAACGFAAVLYKVVTSDTVSGAITKLVQRALDAGF